MAGEVIGPQLACSRIAAAGGRLVGAALLYDHDGEPPLGGPWVGELFRHPDAPPGRAPRCWPPRSPPPAPTGLATRRPASSRDGNPARRLYDAPGSSSGPRSVASRSLAAPG